MKTYEVFNAGAILVKVTEADLQNAVLSPHHLSVEIMHAAAKSSFHQLIPKIIETLTANVTIQRRVAAITLLALNSTSSIETLLKLSEAEQDKAVSYIFRAVALRLQGIEQVRYNFFNASSDPTFHRYLILIYNSNIKFTKEDLIFLLEALNLYNNQSADWIRDRTRNMNSEDVKSILLFISADRNKIETLIDSQTETQTIIATLNTTMERYNFRDVRNLCGKLIKRISRVDSSHLAAVPRAGE